MSIRLIITIVLSLIYNFINGQEKNTKKNFKTYLYTGISYNMPIEFSKNTLHNPQIGFDGGISIENKLYNNLDLTCIWISFKNI